MISFLGDEMESSARRSERSPSVVVVDVAWVSSVLAPMAFAGLLGVIESSARRSEISLDSMVFGGLLGRA